MRPDRIALYMGSSAFCYASKPERFDAMNSRAQETANTILEAFRNPESLPKTIAPIFIHRNDDTPCRKWSWRNQLLTALAGAHDARGYKQWLAGGRHVKKGSKAFFILSPCTKKVKNEAGEDRFQVYGFKGTAVFRIEDTEGDDIPSGNPALDSWIAELPLRDVAESWAITVSTFDGEGARYRGCYRERGENKSIALGVQNVSVFLHELMHAADYRLGNAAEKGPHWRKETVAEFGAAILAECLGLEAEKDIGGAYRYIEQYAKAAEKDVQAACIECLDRICEAVNLILATAETLIHNAAAVA